MLIDDYVADLSRALAGPAGPKRDLVVEARDSLTDTADALEAQGLGREAAERVAVEEFGDVAEIAPGYQDELTAAAGRRLGALLFLTLPLSVLIWSAIWHVFPGDHSSWSARPVWYTAATALLDAVQVVAGLYGGLALFALGRGARRFRRTVPITRSLGLTVMVTLPLCGLLSLLVTAVSDLPSGFDRLAPVMLAELVTSAFWGLQFYCAVRCLTLTRRARA
ncbi:permease prefix domain 1-containing protein [Nonomuraea sp. NPDC047897]|uniref:permease prefix domain 1-containing protein n=1 Tax=Nonomuraea sp. NPDC047897 TaxID=3364346 RepID=UPI00371F3E1F